MNSVGIKEREPELNGDNDEEFYIIKIKKSFVGKIKEPVVKFFKRLYNKFLDELVNLIVKVVLFILLGYLLNYYGVINLEEALKQFVSFDSRIETRALNSSKSAPVNDGDTKSILVVRDICNAE